MNRTAMNRSAVISLSFAAAMAVHGLAAAQASPPTLNDARKAVRDGTTPGIVLIPARSKAAPAADAASGASAPKPAGSFLEEVKRILPPSGRPLSSARRLDAPDLGIPLPTQGASAPAR